MKFLKLLLILSTIVCIVSCAKEKTKSSIVVEDRKKLEDQAINIDSLPWPRQLKAYDGTVTMFQPQIEQWQGETLKAKAAVVVETKDSKNQDYGSIWFTTKTHTNMDNRIVTLYDIKLTKINFPGSDNANLRNIISDVIPSSPRKISLERLLSYSQKKEIKNVQPQTQTALRNSPPSIYVRNQETLLILIDGEPVLRPIGDSGLLHVINSKWDIILASEASSYYLLYKEQCLVASDLQGTWKTTTKLPQSCSQIPENHPRNAFRKTLETTLKNDTAPQVIVSTKPAELVIINGNQELSPIDNTKLLYVKNTESDVFFHIPTNHYYVLLAGRWFMSNKLADTKKVEWKYVSGKNLPKDIKLIPEHHDKARVLASVPETDKAAEAVRMAYIPRKVTIKKQNLKLTVVYDGKPEFTVITGTNLSRATNTAYDVILVGQKYYCCYQAVWFISSSPGGSWNVADSIPSEIYQIPPSSPAYRITFVTIYDSTKDTVTIGYTAGYSGCYVHDGVVVYGTGYYYIPYVGTEYYYALPLTYGVSVHYSYYNGGFVACGWYYSPYHYYYHDYDRHHHHHRDWSVSTYQNHNNYAHWGKSVISDGKYWARTGHVSTDRGTAFGFETSKGKKGIIVRGEKDNTVGVGKYKNNVYVGRNGEIYKRNNNGWKHYDDGKWKDINWDNKKQKIQNKRSTTSKNFKSRYSPSTYENLRRNFRSRSRGSYNTSRYRQWRSSSRRSFRSRSRGGFSRGRR